MRKMRKRRKNEENKEAKQETANAYVDMIIWSVNGIDDCTG